jgi:hypothetical protein
VNEFEPETKALFGAAREGLEPMPADRARVGRALETRLGVAVVTASASITATAGAAGSAVGAASTLGVVAKWVSIGLLLGVGGASGYAVVSSTGSHAPVPAAPASRLVVPSGAAPTSAPRMVPPVSELDAPTRAAPGPAAAAVHDEPRDKVTAAAASALQPSGHVGEEAALLRKADEALRGGDANRALILLREHNLRFPGGILAEERSAELVTTLCRLGRTAEARREAEQFLRVTPDSPLAASVRSTCASAEGAPAR